MSSILKEDFRYLLAITLVNGIGPVVTRHLISAYGNARDVFDQPVKDLVKIPGITPEIAGELKQAKTLKQADKEIAWMEAKRITPLHYWEEGFPQRLKHQSDAPVMLFYKGEADLNASRMVAIVGTRHATHYGRSVTEELVAGLVPYGVVVVSGLAFGIDVIAHKAALENQIPTIAVVAHGLDRIYPPAHTDVARRLTEEGGILTEFLPGNDPEKANFPKRNRIVAGMSDALIVVETGEHGGAMITASLAGAYHKDVFAVPGEVKHPYSIGCNKLIKKNLAQLIENADDLAISMNWKTSHKKRKTQRELFLELNVEEKLVLQLLEAKGALHIDELSALCGLTPGVLSGTLLSLEFQSLITCLPGKRYGKT